MPKVLVETVVILPSNPEPKRSVITCKDQKEAIEFVDIKFNRLSQAGTPFTFLYSIQEEVDSDA